jgi:hypothetical protein
MGMSEHLIYSMIVRGEKKEIKETLRSGLAKALARQENILPFSAVYMAARRDSTRLPIGALITWSHGPHMITDDRGFDYFQLHGLQPY